jgi:hypothetical protein
MAARTRRGAASGWDQAVRTRIKTSMLLNRLHDHVFKEGVELSQTQIKAVEILLKKSVPDLAAMQLSGDANNPIAVDVIERVIKRPNAHD